MDLGSLQEWAVPAISMVGGFAGGRRMGARQSVDIAVSTVELLQAGQAQLESQSREKDDKISALEGKVEVLEQLVTQRAEVAEVKGIVERIASKVGA